MVSTTWKRLGCLFLAVCLMGFGTLAFAEEPDITVAVNGQLLETDVPPVITEGRTMLPMRAIFEALGAKVNWIEDQQMVVASKGNYIISLMIGKNILLLFDLTTLKEERLELNVPPFIVEGRTLVPVRAVSEALGATVDWDGELRKVTITK